MENNNGNKSLSYRVGQIFGTIFVGCIAAILVALTARLIGWILF